MGLIAALLTTPLDADVLIKQRPNPLEVRADGYEAVVDWDGCLTNLRIDGLEFLAAGVSISRGSYFYQDGPLQLTELERSSEDTINAKSGAAAIEYEFAGDRMVWTAENLTAQPMVLFLVLAGEIEAVLDKTGALGRGAITEDTDQLTCFRGTAALTLAGLDRVWGPWEGHHQVAQVDLKPGERKVITLQVAKTTSDQRTQIAALLNPNPERTLTLVSPRPYQVFQRQTAVAGEVLISGHCQEEVDAVEFLVSGESSHGDLPAGWQLITPVAKTRQFNLRLRLPSGGWYALEARAKKGKEVIAEIAVDKFGVGEVFVGAGQSNSTNCGQFKTRQHTGMVASFGGTGWQLADDPQPGAADKSEGGSFWPAFGDALYEKYGVPIGVAVTGFGGTSVNQWQPDDDLFDWMMKRVHQLGPNGFRGLLWHQGESDVGMSAEEYYLKLKNVIASSRTQAYWEFPWFVAQASYHNPEQARDEPIRSAQQQLWEDGVALRGPDTDTLVGDHRDFEGAGIHFSPQGLKAHGEMWAQRVSVYLDEVLELSVLEAR